MTDKPLPESSEKQSEDHDTRGGTMEMREGQDLPHRKSGDSSALRQTCKACGHIDKFNFNVPDDLWAAVVPTDMVSKVVCLACFDGFAHDKGIDYSAGISSLFFAGDVASFEFVDVASTGAAMGRRGGLARATKLPPVEREAIAYKAAITRWWKRGATGAESKPDAVAVDPVAEAQD
jgi:hypothetical protein